ncbi:family 43 glycosylhydrolase [Devosia rhodophyticola]|uniref:Family 43 glycosylhydrolase n=1 Tax=Devosia rhodophyticola TaxID=3026423 RepID=A0ABY7YU15_9HYPH|nr:family 43 glycosylhydrolase [Devosia rhodophyticola]WDR04799.1 family 43 glycosylhydrolase [Devosia rhodophyticola]
MTTLSLATKRAENYPEKQGEWYCGFSYTPLIGLGYEPGVHRRDASSIIRVDGLYYVYYTRSVGPHFGRGVGDGTEHKIFPWDYADIYFATSADGMVWEEQGPAVARGEPGSFDARTVCTPDVLEHAGKYYLVYQTQSDKEPYASGRSERVGLAISDSPRGPWRKIETPILTRMDDGEWFGKSDNYNSGLFGGITHDPSLFFYQGQWWLYYKCGSTKEMQGGKHKFAGPDTRWGVAMSDKPEGPYTHSEFNPITNSGHETMLWHYKGGIAALLNRDGPESDTIQWAPDGINFSIMAHVHSTPQAAGAYRPASSDGHPLDGIRWGMCHLNQQGSQWNYMVRFDVDPRHSHSIAMGYAKSTIGEI